MRGNLSRRLALLGASVGMIVGLHAQAACTAGSPNAGVIESTPTGELVDTGSGAVTHTKTGLTWKHCAEGQTWNGSTCTGTPTTTNWADALKTANTANAAAFAGFKDWRLPNKKELESIIEYCGFVPAINQTVFPGTPSLTFWTGSSYVVDPAYAWAVYFGDGGSFANAKVSSGGYARLVRGGPSSDSFDSLAPRDGLWIVNTEAGASGRGFQIEIRNGTLVFTYYGYEGSGNGMWALSSGPMTGSAFSGSMNLYRAGTVLGGTYAPAASAGSAGSVSINFTSPTAGTITFPGETQKAITKFDFSGSSAPRIVPADGLWIVNSEAGAPGRGFQIEQKNGLLVLTYFGYLSDGGALWTLSSENMSGSGFTAPMGTYQGGTTLGGTYHAATPAAGMGTVSINFTSATTGTITFPGEAPKAISKFVW